MSIHLYVNPSNVQRFGKRVTLSLALLALVGGLRTAPLAQAATVTLYVSPNGSDSNACSAVHPCRTISHASFVAAAGDTISVAPGTYPEHLAFSKNVTVRGASLSSTVIDGGAVARVIDVLPGVTVTLAELTVQNGKETGVAGGGISNAGMMTLKQVIVAKNTTSGGTTANDNGGGIWNTGTLSIISSFIAGNHADNDGGGIYNQSGTLTVQNSVIRGNNAGYGGGIENQAVATLTHTNLVVNSAQNEGGGLDNSSPATVTLSNVTFSGNSATGTFGAGGGMIQKSTSPASLNNVTFRNNSAGEGGGLLNTSQVTSLTAVTFDGNVAGNGGGLENFGGAVTLTNITLSDNGASIGGGLFEWGGAVTLTNATFSGNISTGECNGGNCGSGIYILLGTVRLKNTIVANSPIGGNCAGAITDNGHNLDSGNTCGFGAANHDLINTNPLLGPLQNNGGYTDTLALLKGSPAINKGTDAGCPKKDQRGKTRITSTDPTCDIGAYEYP